MPARPDLEAKLATVDDWVRDSFAHLSDLLISMGCQHREVTAPGRSFRLGNGPSVHLHPKQSYIGVGLPRSMQEDVEALSAYPHRKDGPAWVRYGPDDVDRDTMELLLSSAVVRCRPRKQAGSYQCARLRAPSSSGQLSPGADSAEPGS